jgi:hypothetical protein
MSWWADAEIEKALDKERRLMKERGEAVLALVPPTWTVTYLADGIAGKRLR